MVCSFQVFATTPQFLDSLRQVIRTTKNVERKLNALYCLSYEYGLIAPSTGIEYGRQCLELAKKAHRLDFQFNAYNGIATCYETLADFEKALYFHRKSRAVGTAMKKPNWVAIADVNIASCYKQLGQYKTALKRYLAAYRVLTKSGDYNPRLHIYLGEIYLKTGDYARAEYHSRIGIKRSQQRHEVYISYNAIINLAKCLQHNGQPDSAALLLNNAFAGLKANTDQFSLALCLNALGELHMEKRDYRNAFHYFKKELSVHQKTKNKNGLYLSFLNLANCAAHFPTRDNGRILGYIAEANKYFSTVRKNNDMLLDAYQKMAKTYELINRPNDALRNYKLYFELNEALLSKETLQQVKELQTGHEAARREGELKLLRQQKLISRLKLQEQQASLNQQRYLLILLVAGLILIAFVGYYYIANQRLKNSLQKEAAIKDTEEKERLRISKDIHDDLGSGLSRINFLSEFIVRKPAGDAETKEKAEAISETSKQLVMNMRDLIWAMNPENMTLQSFVFRIREYTSDYLEDFPADLTFDLPDEIQPYPITKENYRNLLMVVKESLNNIVKHSGATEVHVRAALMNNQWLEISVRDNGSGIPTDGRKGNGLANMRARVEQIGGELEVQTADNEGTVITARLSLMLPEHSAQKPQQEILLLW